MRTDWSCEELGFVRGGGEFLRCFSSFISPRNICHDKCHPYIVLCRANDFKSVTCHAELGNELFRGDNVW